MARTAACVAGALAVAVPIAMPASPPVAVTVQARPGAVDGVVHALGASALRVQRRHGRTVQVVTSPERIDDLRRLPGVAAAGVAAPAFADEGPVVSQGVFRTGAAALGPVAGGGEGLVIAILDLGFGTSLDARRAAGELPPAEATEAMSFDSVNGLAGRNAYGNATNHGELVAQTVFDYAPKARFILVNYRTVEDFVVAVDALIARHPDIVVHSNSFLEGPFDGTGVSAQAVNRAAAAGILWFNSAGNYAHGHWAGPWVDADADSRLDWGGAEQGLFYRAASQPITFAVSWTQPATGPRTDLDVALERRNDDGTWADVAASTDSQTAGAAPAERITGYLPPADGYFRLSVRRVAGPPPPGDVTVFSREIDLPLVMGGSTVGSVPTPGDAAGAISVGATDWRGDRLKSYSSQGPTADGRLKPDLVAPTDTTLAGPNGPRQVGGTSNSAPNAAGAAALLLAGMRRQGLAPTADQIRAELVVNALDLGDPGPDNLFGAGRVRVERTGPAITEPQPAPNLAVRGVVTVAAHATDPSRVARLWVSVDGVQLGDARAREAVGARLDTTAYPDGPVTVSADAVDWAGNPSHREWTVTVDNTRPVVTLLRSVIARRRGGVPASSPRPAFALVRVREAGGPVRLRVLAKGGRARLLTVTSAPLRRVPLGRLRPGRVTVRLEATDRAGNVRVVQRAQRLRPETRLP